MYIHMYGCMLLCVCVCVRARARAPVYISDTDKSKQTELLNLRNSYLKFEI